MESQESQQQTGIRGHFIDGEPSATLLANVLNRIDQYHTQRSTPQSLQSHVHNLSDPRWEVRAAAIQALGAMDTQPPLEPLLTALQDEHAIVRAAAIRAVGQRGKEVPLRYFLQALQDHAWEVREMVALTLVRYPQRDHTANTPGDRELELSVRRSLLHIALQDKNSSVREAASYALSTLQQRDTAEQKSRSSRLQLNTAWRAIAHHWLVLGKQLTIIHKSLWIGPALLMLLQTLITLYSQSTDTTWFLALITTVSAAVGGAFIYGAEHDPGMEITLSTPTSPRLVMFCRFVLVVGYNISLSLFASALLALTHGGSTWEIVQFWLGPLLLVSSIALTLSLLLGSWFSLFTSLALEAMQILQVDIDRHLPVISLVPSSIWQTNPTILLLAACLLLLALIYAPRQTRQVNNGL